MISTTTALTSSTNPSTYHSTVTFTATVTPGSGGGAAMTGTVTFFNGNVSIGAATVTWNSGPSTGQATLATAALPGGSPSITAAYSGDGNYTNSASSALTQTVNGLTPTVALTLSVPAPVYGQPVTITADVGSSSWSLLAATGTITFKDGGTTLGTAPLVATLSSSGPVGQAVLTVASFSVGSHSISATYPGDSNFASATSSSYPMTVSKATSGTNVTASANPSALCQAVTFTASVSAASPGSGTPTGTVTFSVNGTAVGTVSLVSGSATYSSSSLSSGSNTIVAQYNGDGNFLTSSGPLMQTVNAAVNWVLTAAAAAPDSVQGVLLPFGTAQVSPLTGNLQRALALDANQHAGCGCGGKCGCGGGCGGGCGCADDNCKAGTAPLALVYNSATTSSNVLPIILATLASDFCAAVPSQIQAQLTWNGTAQGWVTFGTTGHSAGDVYALPLQVGSAVGSSGIYPWSVEVKATVGTFVYDRTASGTLPVVVNAAGNGCGNGWAVGGTWSLLIGTSGVAIVDNRTGGVRYFTGTGPSYTSPANDQGTLVKNMGGSYTYTAKDQLKTNFDSSGKMTGQVDPHGLTQTLAYSAGLLSTLTACDGGVATFTYSGGLLQTVQEPGGRTLTLSYDVHNNLTGFIDAAGGVYTFNYDGSNRLVNEQVGPLNTTYTYATANGTLTQINRGLGTTLSVAAAAAQGLGASTAINASAAAAALTDALSHVTSYTLDALGRPTQVQTADGAVQTWALDAAGNPTVYVDQIGRVTSYTYNASEDLTQVQWPDSTRTTYQYDTTFHQLTVIQDALNHRTTNTYDGTTSDLLTVKDALAHVTSYTWSSGLKQTMTDALGRVTTHQWDSTKRRQTATVDALGNVTSYTFDSAGNQTSIQDALGRYTSATYDGNRQVLTQQNALGGLASMTYDAIGDLTSQVDELGRTTSYNYDQRALRVSVTEAVGTAVQRTTTTNYDAAANVLYVTSPLGDITSLAYDVLNRQISKIEAYGTSVQRTTTTVYDQASNVLSNIDARGTTTSYLYDVRNRRLQQIDAYGTSLQRITAMLYDAVGNTLSVTNPRNTVTSYGFDAVNRRTQQIDANGTSLQRTTTTVYDAVGNTLSVTSPVGVITSMGYDALYRQTQFVEAYGSAVQRTSTTIYDAVGNVIARINPRNYTTSYVYDVLNRGVQRLDAYGTGLQRTVTTVYDAVSNVMSVVNGLGVVTSFGYDALSRCTTELDAYGTALQRTLTTVYDAESNVIASIDAIAYATTYNYDALNRRVSVQDAGGGIGTTAYDANNVAKQIDQLANTTTYNYDVLNRNTQTVSPRGGTTTLAYDANNNLLGLLDPVNNLTQWLFDALDRKVQEIDPLGNSGTFAFDAADRMTSATDRIGQRIAYTYDLLNRETSETWYNAAGTSVNVLTFTYDANNNLLTAVNNAATNTMAYDALDRTTSVQTPFAAVLTYSYDPANNRTLVQDSSGGTTTRVYDTLNRTATMQFGGSGLTPLREDFTYTARDQVATQTRYSDLAGTTKIGSTTYSYDALGRIQNLQHRDGSGTLLANYTNTYDLASRITAETLNGGAATTYTYDADDELTNDSQVTYTYDLNGNRTMSGYTTGSANLVTSDGTWNYFYDQNGNRIGKRNISTGEWWSYGYDNANRLVSAQDVTSGVQTQATYVYDALGKRVEKDVWTQSGGSTTTSRFAYDGREIWADVSSSNSLQSRYVRAAAALELLARVTSGGALAWLLTDRMDSVRNVVDSTGAVIDTITYDGYGNVTVETSQANGGQYKYDGYRSDSETGLLRPDPSLGRYYDPGTGRWTSEDPIKFEAADTNLARYVGNNPTNFIDPSGLRPDRSADLIRIIMSGSGSAGDRFARVVDQLTYPLTSKERMLLSDMVFNAYGKDDFVASQWPIAYAAALYALQQDFRATWGLGPTTKGGWDKRLHKCKNCDSINREIDAYVPLLASEHFSVREKGSKGIKALLERALQMRDFNTFYCIVDRLKWILKNNKDAEVKKRIEDLLDTEPFRELIKAYEMGWFW